MTPYRRDSAEALESGELKLTTVVSGARHKLTRGYEPDEATTKK